MIRRVGFVGLGNMGFPMARHLALAGFDLVLFDVRGAQVDRFVAQHGGTAAASLAELGQGSDAVITMLPDGATVRAALLGPGGVAASMRPGSVVIDMSTADPIGTRALGAALAARGIACLDAPVAGGVPFAETGRLAITVGGDAAELERCRPLLAAMGNDIFHCGALGAGHALKALNNFVNAAALATAIEALTIGRKLGLDMTTMVAAMTTATTGANHPLDKKIKPQVLTRRFATGMPIRLIAKDVGIALAIANALGVDAPCAALTHRLWQDAIERVGALCDQTEIARMWEDQAGVVLEER